MATDVLHSLEQDSTTRPAAQTKEEPDNSYNPYLAARKAWDERYGDLISRAKNWRAAASLPGTIARPSAAGCFVIAKRGKVPPCVGGVESAGRVQPGGGAGQPPTADDRMKRAAIYQ